MGYGLEFDGLVPYQLSQEGSSVDMIIGAKPEDLTVIDWTVTYNFSKWLDKAFAGVELDEELANRKTLSGNRDWGLWRLDGKDNLQQQAALQKALDVLRSPELQANWIEGLEKEFLRDYRRIRNNMFSPLIGRIMDICYGSDFDIFKINEVGTRLIFTGKFSDFMVKRLSKSYWLASPSRVGDFIERMLDISRWWAEHAHDPAYSGTWYRRSF